MKYLHQAAIIAAVTFAAELIKYFLPWPIPTSIYGLILLFLLLKTGIVKLKDVADVGGLLIELMPLILIPACVTLLTAVDSLKVVLLPALIMSFGGTLVVMITTGLVAQHMTKRKTEGKSYE